ncbi:MAG: LmbE family protein [Candidatus Saccharibacteria bacterium]|nr:LmbE family protein [Candidatus Saccharibacteria bacterium]
MNDSLQPAIALGIVAHPDDLDFGASGTFAKWIAQGTEAYYLILTDGSKGSTDYEVSPEELTQTRRAEQVAAGKVLGLKDVFFLDYPDGGLEVTMELKREIVRYIRRIRPDVVVTMDPSVLYDVETGFVNHPDHRAAGQATLDAVFPLARDHLSFPELYTDEHLEPHKVKQALLINMTTGNYWTDLSSWRSKKLDVLRAHASQVPADDAALTELVERIGGRAAAGQPYDLAEQFVRLDLMP